MQRLLPALGLWLGIRGCAFSPRVEQLLQLRVRLRRLRRFEAADRVLHRVAPQLERQGLFVEDAKDGSFRLIRHPRLALSDQQAAAARGKAARLAARQALARSLAADTLAEAAAVAARAAEEVRRHLHSEEASKGQALLGRQSVDLAFSLALAGCRDEDLFQELGDIAERELARSKALVNCQQLVERLASAGFRQKDFPDIYRRALEALQRLGCPESEGLRDLRAGNFSLNSKWPLLWLFRHATRQGRRSVPPARCPELNEAVAKLDGTRPLAIDLGCGFGVSSLGLAMQRHSVLAVDASVHCVNFAAAMACRWRLPADVLQVAHCAAEEALDAARGFGGEVEWILINFPTPFAAMEDREAPSSGNSQLPSSVHSAEFMANRELLRKAKGVLASGGTLLVQSNVEDLAVTLREIAEAESSQWQSRRLMRHLQSGRRAEGAGWLLGVRKSRDISGRSKRCQVGLLSFAQVRDWVSVSATRSCTADKEDNRKLQGQLAATETEAYYIGEALPIHRVALRPKKAAGCRVSSYERLPAEISGLKPQQVALLTMEEQRLLRVRQSKLKELKICRKPMLFEDDFATPSRVRSDLELMKQLQEQNPTWDHFDLTYLAPEDCASLLAHKVRAARDAAALRMD
ncbi:unnamed protein product [Effrenium voratum]|nr:unnamed protein product [Effrenium voratum]